MATTATRKRPGRDEAEEERPTLRHRVEEEVSDGEVEEFFAILRRMREVARFFSAKGGGGGVRGEAKGKGKGEGQRQGSSRWRPAFEREDFEEAGTLDDAERPRRRRMAVETESSGGRGRSKEAAVAENGIAGGRLPDLNAEPACEE